MTDATVTFPPEFWERVRAIVREEMAASPELPPSGWVKASDVPAVVPDFDTAALLQGGSAPRVVTGLDQAAFRLHQGVPQGVLSDVVNAVDPVFITDKSKHLHVWFNRGDVPVSGDYRAIRTTGRPIGEGREINRTIYGYAPLLVQDMDDRWHLLLQDTAIVYYKQWHPAHPRWAQLGASPAKLPRGLKLLGGNRHYPGHTAATVRVLEGNPNNPRAVAGAGATRRLDSLLPHCTPGRLLYMDISFPSWWDGEHVDSPDHVSHVSYAQGGRTQLLPSISYHVQHTLPAWPIKRLICSADADNGFDNLFEPGSQMHAYWLDGWVDEFREKISDVTFARNLTANNGDFGDGVALKWRDTAAAMKPRTILLNSPSATA